MGRPWEEPLATTGRFVIVPSGNSMWPMIRSQRDVVEITKLEGSAQRYDLVLFTRDDTQHGVLHRVLEARENDYVIAGDNCGWKEAVPKDRVVGIVTRFYRKGKWYDVNHRGYRLYVRVWTDLFFLRSPIMNFRNRVLRKLRRMRAKK